MAEGIDFSKLPGDLFVKQEDWSSPQDALEGSAREVASFTLRGPGTLMGTLGTRRLLRKAGKAQGLNNPDSDWFLVGMVNVENINYLIVQPVDPNTSGAVENDPVDSRPLALTGLHHLFRRKGVDLSSTDGRRCTSLSVQNVPGRGWCVVADFSNGSPLKYASGGAAGEEEPAPPAAAG